MSNFSKITKRVLAGALAALLVLTSAPGDVFAGEIDLIDSSIESVVEEQDIEVVAEEAEALELNAASEDEALAEEEVVDEEDTASLMMNFYSITVTAEDPEADLLGDGRKVKELQSDIDFEEDGDVIYVTGTSKFVTGYTAFDPNRADLQTGNYVAIRFATNAAKVYGKPSTTDPSEFTNPLGYDLTDDFLLTRLDENKEKYLELTAVDSDGNIVATKTVKYNKIKTESAAIVLSAEPEDNALMGTGAEPDRPKYLQSDIQFVDDTTEVDLVHVAGTLKYVSGYTAFDPNHPELQEGYYIAVHFATTAAKVYAKVINGQTPESEYPDKDYGYDVTNDCFVVKVSENELETKGFNVTAFDAEGNVVATKTVKLDNLVLEAAPAFVDIQVVSKNIKIDLLKAWDIFEQDGLTRFNELVVFSTNGVRVCPVAVKRETDNIWVARYAIKDGANYTLSVDTSLLPGMYGYDFIDYAIGTWDATKGEYVYGKPVSIKNNKFSYKGTAYAGKPSLVDIGTCDPVLATTAKDMTVKQIAKSIYTGQELILANVKYGKGIFLGAPTVTCDKLIGGYGCDYDYLTGDLSLEIDDSVVDAGKVKFTITAYGDGAYQPISKTLTVNVLNRIDALSLEGPEKIYKADGKAANASYKVDYLGYLGINGPTPATKKATFKVVENYGTPDEKEVPGITVKNGKVSIAKNYLIKDPSGTDTYRLVAKAADYEENNAKTYAEISITSEKPDYAEVMLVKHDSLNGKYNRVKGNTITVDDVVENHFNAYEFVVRPSYVPVKDTYDSLEIINDCAFKASNSAVKFIARGVLDVTKEVKNFTVTATATDGSKVSVKSGKYNIVYSDRVGLRLLNQNYHYDEYCSDQEVNYVMPTFDGQETAMLKIEGVGKNGESVVPSNFSVSVKNGTKQKTERAELLSLTIKDLKKPMIVTLTDKKTKEKKVYTFETDFAPEVLEKPSLTAGLVKEQTLTFDVKAPKDFTDPKFPPTVADINFVRFGLREKTKNKNLINLVETISNYNRSDVTITPADTEGVVNVAVVLKNTNLVKGKYNLFMLLEFGSEGYETGIAPITIEVKAAPKVTYKPNKNGETITMNRFGKGTIDVSKAKNLDRVEIMNARNVIVNGEPNAFTTFFQVDDGNIWLTEVGRKASLATLNANNRGYIEYKAYNGSSYATGYTFVSVNVNGVAFDVDPLAVTKYGVDPSNYQNFNIEYRTDLDKYVAVGKLKKYTDNAWTEGTWPEEQQKGFYIGLKFGKECWTDGDKVEVAKVVRGTEETDIKWIELDKVESYIVAHLDPSVDYEGIVCKVSKAGKEVGRYVIDLDQLVAE